MAVKTIYICDNCGETILDPLQIITAIRMGGASLYGDEGGDSFDFCSIVCFEEKHLTMLNNND